MSRRHFEAIADDGRTLAVVDLTRADFAIALPDSDLEALCDRFVSESARRQDVPASVVEALGQSVLGRGLMAAAGTFLSGLNSYLLKLGPGNLGAWATPIDEKIAASFPALVTRLRLQDMARLLADGAVDLLKTARRRRLCLVNIAGGVAADSWNALLYLQAEHPGLLEGRPISIAVLDIDAQGPRFGAAAVGALGGAGGPLSGLDVSWQHVGYDWAAPDRFGPVLAEIGDSNAACAVSSEGGLFEYGSDAEIVANLVALHARTPSDAFFAGSVTRKGAATDASRLGSRAATRPRTLDHFGALCDEAGWQLHRVIQRPFSYNVHLVKRR
jgi:hypothetical protein